MEDKLGDFKASQIDAGLGLGMNYFVSSNFSIEAGVAVLGYILMIMVDDNGGDGADATNSFNFGLVNWRAVNFRS
jgi:hypothetical protein